MKQNNNYYTSVIMLNLIIVIDIDTMDVVVMQSTYSVHYIQIKHNE